MNTILISYDLWWPESSDSYKKLIDAIKGYSKRCTPLKSQRIIKTTQTSKEVCTELKKFLDTNDKMLCITITSDYRWSSGLSEKVLDRMKTNI